MNHRGRLDRLEDVVGHDDEHDRLSSALCEFLIEQMRLRGVEPYILDGRIAWGGTTDQVLAFGDILRALQDEKLHLPEGTEIRLVMGDPLL